MIYGRQSRAQNFFFGTGCSRRKRPKPFDVSAFRCRIFLPDAVKHNFAFDFAVNCVYAERFMASEDWLFVAEAPLFSDFEEWIDEGNSTLTLSLRCREKEKELLSVFCQVFFGIDLKLLTVLSNIKPAVTSCRIWKVPFNN